MHPRHALPDWINGKAFEILRNRLEPLQSAVLGITGAGGAGKTTFAQNITAYFGHDLALAVDLDDYLLSRTKRGRLQR